MNEYNHLTLDELRRRILVDPFDGGAYREWFRRTQHVTAQQVREAARVAS